MIRTIVFVTAGLIAVPGVSAQTRIVTLPKPGAASSVKAWDDQGEAPRFRVREHAPFAAFEYDVLNKGFEKRNTYETLWKQAMRVCEEQNGYVIEYREGTKRLVLDTREGGHRGRAYAVCALASAPEPLLATSDVEPDVTMSGDALAPGGRATVIASGEKRQAYTAAREHAYRTCLGDDRRIDRMSVGFNTIPNHTAQVAFSCGETRIGN